MLADDNSDKLASHYAWIPVHFLPGNGGYDLKGGHALTFADKLVCKQNSHIARGMARERINRRTEKNALHRLGIAMHVYADTWVHQGFDEIKHAVNRASNIEATNRDTREIGITGRLKSLLGDLFDEAKSEFIGDCLALGHCTVLSYPDQPSLRWNYTNGNGQVIKRNNPLDFLEAADCKGDRNA